MKSSIGWGCRGALLAITALAVACGGGGGGTSTGTGGSGTAGNGTNGTTSGGGCQHVGNPCSSTKPCCNNLSCNGFGVCVGAGTTTGSGTTTGTPVDTCPLSDVGGACTTSVECQAGLLCVDGGCAAPVPAAPICQTIGSGPMPGEPCCESTLDAGSGGVSCVAWDACITQGHACAAGDTCCNGLSCGTDGTCDPVCGAALASCTTNSDCCTSEGLTCVKGSFFNNTPPIPGSICYAVGLPAQQVPTGGSYYCDDQPQCAAFDAGVAGVIDCQLGATCNAGIPEDGGTDPCSQDGLVCDQFNNIPTCRNPDLFEPCVQGGPACNPPAFVNTTSPVVCSDAIFGQLQPVSVCTFECQTAEDCAPPWMTCYAALNPSDEDCAFNENCGMTASDLLKPCNAAGNNDGICFAIGGETPSNSFGLCTQAATDGDGGPGAPCNVGGDRQIGGLCDLNDVCAGNVCGALCNAGTLKTPACGAGQTCIPIIAEYGINLGPDPTNDSYTTGGCVIPCDFTQPGTCTPTSQGVPTKCLPAELFGYTPKEVPDFCMAAPTAAEALPLGADCSKAVFGNAVDPCVDGALCLGGGIFGGTPTCTQLCEDSAIGKTGAPACPTGYKCTAINFTGTDSTHTGECVAPANDGG